MNLAVQLFNDKVKMYEEGIFLTVRTAIGADPALSLGQWQTTLMDISNMIHEEIFEILNEKTDDSSNDG